MNSRAAFVCDTAYQVFNVLNFIISEKQKDADLYLSVNFPDAEQLGIRIKEKALFHNVILTNPHFRMEHEGKLHWYLRHGLSYMFPKRTLLRDSRRTDLSYDKYKRIYTSTLNCYAVCLISVNKGAEVCFIDDGAGSYFAYDKQQGTSKLHHLYSRLFRKGAENIRPVRIYLYSTRNGEKYSDVPVYPLPAPKGEFLALAKELFRISDCKSEQSHMVWLTHPDALKISTESIDKTVRDHFKKYKEILGVRLHPRDERRTFYDGFRIEDNKELWELELSFYDMERLVLIGTYSTAQMTPKLLYDMEPTVVILCHLYRNVYEKFLYEKIVQASMDFRKLYRDPEKVKLPHDFEELDDILKHLAERRKE